MIIQVNNGSTRARLWCDDGHRYDHPGEQWQYQGETLMERWSSLWSSRWTMASSGSRTRDQCWLKLTLDKEQMRKTSYMFLGDWLNLVLMDLTSECRGGQAVCKKCTGCRFCSHDLTNVTQCVVVVWSSTLRINHVRLAKRGEDERRSSARAIAHNFNYSFPINLLQPFCFYL